MGDRKNQICQHNHLICTHPQNKMKCLNNNILLNIRKDDKTTLEILKNMLIKIPDYSKLIYESNDYIKIRKQIIIFLKEITCQFYLCDKTFHLALSLLDRIFLKINNIQFIQSIAMFCIILACKFIEEDTFKANLIQKTYSKFFTENYLSDEFYILNLLDFNFNITSTYDILLYFLNYRLIYFKDEKDIFEKYSQKFSVYHLAIEYLNNLIEKNIVLTLNPIQISFGIIQLIRKRIGLNPFKIELYKEFAFLNNEKNINKGYEIFFNIFYKKKNKLSEKEEKENKNSSDKNIIIQEKKNYENFQNENLLCLIRKAL